ncbi:chemotaxis protein CheB [Virgisporangium aliadipatigenens]|uniref:protein-glutamate methylesterase n=1 Tax=Virgisporangium aliadipatigenens TaxID=741659 RepID=A0A8J3YHT1_9ACTN|nr:chemotaxis protein CheB [Virgisporangium aliadipatigenens]GIJ44542.1 chemotaxis protein CheB [Virgisporangium aliadipatigenens]
MAADVLVVVGASAGGIEAIQSLVAGLPVDLPAAVLVVLHVPRSGPSALPHILNRSGPLPARHALDGEPLLPGRIYVAPPDRHLLAVEGHARLTRGPAENGHRPAVDPLFRSVAFDRGAGTVAVVLSGSRDDGTAGAVVLAEAGGTVIVQDPEEALHPSMPRSVIGHVPDALVHTAAELPSAVVSAVRLAAKRCAAAEFAAGKADPFPADDALAMETAIAELQDMTSAELPGTPAGFACPTCHGGLFELAGEPSPRYRCWVGHAWSPQSLLDELGAAFEGALWMALRSLEEKAALARRMSDNAKERGFTGAAARYVEKGEDAENAGALIRELIRRMDAPAGEGTR